MSHGLEDVDKPFDSLVGPGVAGKRVNERVPWNAEGCACVRLGDFVRIGVDVVAVRDDVKSIFASEELPAFLRRVAAVGDDLVSEFAHRGLRGFAILEIRTFVRVEVVERPYDSVADLFCVFEIVDEGSKAMRRRFPAVCPIEMVEPIDVGDIVLLPVGIQPRTRKVLVAGHECDAQLAHREQGPVRIPFVGEREIRTALPEECDVHSEKPDR